MIVDIGTGLHSLRGTPDPDWNCSTHSFFEVAQTDICCGYILHICWKCEELESNREY